MGYAKICEEIKRGKCPEPRKRNKKSETRGKNGQVSGVELGIQRCPLERKNGQVSDSRIRGIYYPPENKREKKKITHVLPKQRSKKRRDSNMRSNEK